MVNFQDNLYIIGSAFGYENSILKVDAQSNIVSTITGWDHWASQDLEFYPVIWSEKGPRLANELIYHALDFAFDKAGNLYVTARIWKGDVGIYKIDPKTNELSGYLNAYVHGQFRLIPPEIGFYTLGSHRKNITDSQKKEYEDLFEKYFLKTFSDQWNSQVILLQPLDSFVFINITPSPFPPLRSHILPLYKKQRVWRKIRDFPPCCGAIFNKGGGKSLGIPLIT